jgi:hypothetical protein
MTSSERKIINFLEETKEKTNVRLIAQKTNLSSDYARLLCRALARSGHIKFENDLCHLLKRGRSRFENNDPAIEPTAVVANVTMLSNDLIASSSVDEQDAGDKKSDGNEDVGQSAVDNGELDKVLAELDSSPKKEEETHQESEEKLEAKIDETPPEAEPMSASIAEPKDEVAQEERAEITPEVELKPQATIEVAEVKESVAGGQEEKAETELPPPVVSSESPEKAAPKEELAKPASSFGMSLKKVVNWFTEKK